MPPWLLSRQFLKWASNNLLWRPPHLRHPLRSRLPVRCAPPPLCQGTPQPVPLPPPSTAASLRPLHSSPVPRLSGAHLTCPSGHFSTRGSSNRSSSHGTCSCLSTSFSPSAPLSLTPCFHTDRGSHPIVQRWSSPCTLPPCYSAPTSLSCPALVSSSLHFSCAPTLLHGML